MLKQAWDYLFKKPEGLETHFSLKNFIEKPRYLNMNGDPLGASRVQRHLLRPAFAASLLIGGAYGLMPIKLDDQKPIQLGIPLGIALAGFGYGLSTLSNLLDKKTKWGRDDFEAMKIVFGDTAVIDTQPDDTQVTSDENYARTEDLRDFIERPQSKMLFLVPAAFNAAVTMAVPPLTPILIMVGTRFNVNAVDYLRYRSMTQKIIDEKWVILDKPPPPRVVEDKKSFDFNFLPSPV